MTTPAIDSIRAQDPKIDVSNTGDHCSFAYETARKRWPGILNDAIETVTSASKTLSHRPDQEVAEEIITKIKSLRDAIANNSIMGRMMEDGQPDIPAYHYELTTWGDPRWLNAPWLFSECYWYRHIQQFFTESGSLYWQDFDIYGTSKADGLRGSKKGTIELLKHFKSVRESCQDPKEVDLDTQRGIFEEMVQISLWGNATDLSLLQGLSLDNLDSIQGKQARDASKANVLVDDTYAAFSLFTSEASGNRSGEVHFVLDNAGFELLTDLVFATYLLHIGYCKRIVLHGKKMPWFVSDVVAHDLDDLVTGFKEGTTYPDLSPEDAEVVAEAGRYWSELLASSALSFQAHRFWTTAHPYGRMAVQAPELHSQIAEAELVVYKGDLNYRKLTYDGMWPHTTPFRKALGPFAVKQNGKGTRILALRTAKADVAVGVEEGKLHGLPEGWTRNGKWGMVQYWDAKR